MGSWRASALSAGTLPRTIAFVRLIGQKLIDVFHSGVFMKRYAALTLSLVAMAGVISCGGGGGDGAVGAPPGPSAEGYYAGTLSVTGAPLPASSTNFQLLVLENGQFWTIYGTPTGGALDVQSFAQGTGTSNGSLFIANNVRYFSNGSVRTSVVSINYNAAAKTASGSSLDDANTTVSFISAPLGTPAYNYASAASLTALQGSWTVKGVSGDLYDLVVLPNGTFTGVPTVVVPPSPTNPANCSFTGSFLPRSSGKNVFDVSLTAGSAPCATPGLASSGVAYVSPVSGGRFQLTFATVSGDRNSGAVLSGVRP